MVSEAAADVGGAALWLGEEVSAVAFGGLGYGHSSPANSRFLPDELPPCYGRQRLSMCSPTS